MESAPSRITVSPVAPVAPYQGGKRRLAGRIITRLRAIPHACYAEPFVGMGGVFLRRDWRARSEVLITPHGLAGG